MPPIADSPPREAKLGVGTGPSAFKSALWRHISRRFDDKLDPAGFSQLIQTCAGLTARQQSLAYEFVCEAAENAILHSTQGSNANARYEVSAQLYDGGNWFVLAVRDWGRGLPASFANANPRAFGATQCHEKFFSDVAVFDSRSAERGRGLEAILGALEELKSAEVSISSGRTTKLWRNGGRTSHTFDHGPVEGVLVRFAFPLGRRNATP